MSCCCKDNRSAPWCAGGDMIWVNSPYPGSAFSATWHPRLSAFLGPNNTVGNFDVSDPEFFSKICYGDFNGYTRSGYGFRACRNGNSITKGIAIANYDGDNCKLVDWNTMTYTEFQIKFEYTEDDEGNAVCNTLGRARSYSYANGLPPPWPSEELMPFQVIYSNSQTSPPACTPIVTLPFDFGPAGTVEISSGCQTNFGGTAMCNSPSTIEVSGAPEGISGPIVPFSASKCISYGSWQGKSEQKYINVVDTVGYCVNNTTEYSATELYAYCGKSGVSYKPWCTDCAWAGSGIVVGFSSMAKGAFDPYFPSCKGNSTMITKDDKGNIMGSQPASIGVGSFADDPFLPRCSTYVAVEDENYTGGINYIQTSITYQGVWQNTPKSVSITYYCVQTDPPDPWGAVFDSTPYIEYSSGSVTVMFS